MTLSNSKRMIALLALAGVVVLFVGLFGATTTSALPDYAAKTGQACGVCHVNPAGGGARTPRGQAFEAIANHTTDPAGAFAASGAAAQPTAAATAAPKPVATPTVAAPAASPTAAPAASPTAAPPKPAASPTAAATAAPGALPRTGGEPIAPLLVGSGAFLVALGWSVRKLLRR